MVELLTRDKWTRIVMSCHLLLLDFNLNHSILGTKNLINWFPTCSSKTKLFNECDFNKIITQSFTTLQFYAIFNYYYSNIKHQKSIVFSIALSKTLNIGFELFKFNCILMALKLYGLLLRLRVLALLPFNSLICKLLNLFYGYDKDKI